MDDVLYAWLERMFNYSNVPKYRGYFKEWVDNITEDQIVGFRRMMEVDYVNRGKSSAE